MTCTANHWANEELHQKAIYGENLALPSSQRALCIMDNFSAQCTDGIIALFESYAIDTVYVPANCAGERTSV